jgi:hypothetical protein
MRPWRFRRLPIARPIVVVLIAGALIAGCRSDAPPVRRDSSVVVAPSPPESTTTVPRSNGWLPAAGPVLLAAGPSPEEAIVFLGAGNESAAALDTGAVDQASATLLGRDGARFTATLELPAGNDNPACRIWPLRQLRATGSGGTWSIGFLSDTVTGIPLDSVGALSARDSMALAAEASRLASAVTANTSPAFEGLRFTVQDARRFQTARGVQALAALLTRRVNQEASPQEEVTFLIAERDSGATSGPYRLAYAERSFGNEEEMSSSELVAAVRIGDGPPSLILARDGNDGLAYSIIERTAPRQWRVRWTSGLAKCVD